MKTAGRRTSGWARGALWVAMACVAIGARGDVALPLYIGNLEPVRDEYGRVMKGSPQPVDQDSRYLLEARTSTDGIIRPPSTTGDPHPYNPLLSADSTGGVGMNATVPDSGIFCLVLTNRPSAGTKLFVRAYNAPTRAESSFYADTPMAQVPSSGSSLAVAFGAAKPLDTGDDDGDGLINSWEKSLGTDSRHTDDYDGDGMSDLHEMLAGTDPTDPSSNLAIRSIRREGDAVASLSEGGGTARPVRIRWRSVPGRRYQLQYVPSLLGDPMYIPVGDVVTAAEGETEIEVLVEVPSEATTGHFRIRLVWD